MSVTSGPALRSETATLLFADIVESVRLVEDDEGANVERIRRLLRCFALDLIPGCNGTLLERRGDGVIAKFAVARQAADCSLRMHAQARRMGLSDSASEGLQLRIALHSARILADDDAVYGRGINMAARLASLATPGNTVMSASVRDQLIDGLDGELHDMGACFLRHVEEPVPVFALRTTSAAQADVPLLSGAAHAAGLGPAVAVLPVEWGAGDARLPSLPEVMVDQLTAALSQSPLLRVISVLSTNAVRGRGMTPLQAAAALGADYVLDGRAQPPQPTPNALRVHWRLLHRASGRCVWEHTLACPVTELLSTRCQAVSETVQALVAAMVDAELVLAHGLPLPNLAAHTLYLAAVDFLHRFSREDFERARLMLETLQGLAPRHPAAPAWMARWHVFRIVQGWSPDVQRDGALARDCAQRALDQDPRSSLALTMAGSVEAGVRLDMAQARTYYDLALASNPNEPLAWLLKGVAHGFMGEGAEALQASERSLQLSPLDPLRFYYDSLSSAAAMGAGRFERAAWLAERAIRGNCRHGSAYRTLAIAQAMQGQREQARATVLRLRAVEPGSSVRQFLARAAVDSEQNRRFARALADAGLPAG